ncbi:hypothetical protein F441_11788 [Phytophthora nicotianae CJ01A1]|uniref:Sugar transporter SWEET1 n=1 Tax=Phytophthora nicotianae CJ01A1 TaxID=1317063 RepID=W2WQY4_PHYNI|nr:hypothetical protein F441_11788 [Phytophthora nicotianae CJ01A1]
MVFWVTLLNVFTGVADILLRLSPVPDIYNVHRNKNIGEMAELPLITMVISCHLWITYRYVTNSFFRIMGSQLFGEIFGIVYNIIYYRWSPEKKRVRLRKLYLMAFAVWCMITLYVVFGVSGVFDQNKSEVGKSLGYAGCAFSLSMFASPLATLKHVVKTRNSASIPINMCTMILISSALGAGSGYLDDDYFVAVINLIGVLLSCIQIVIYFVYRPQTRTDVAVHLSDATLSVLSPKSKAHSTLLVESPVCYNISLSPLVREKAADQ